MSAVRDDHVGRPHFYPDARLPDREWYHVTRLLRKEGSKKAETLAARIDAELADSRRRHDDRLSGRSCQCGHDAAAHTAPLLGGPATRPCWTTNCPCHRWQPQGQTA